MSKLTILKGTGPRRLGFPPTFPFAFAGLWERWQGKDGQPIESCALLTTEAKELVKLIHDRMPVIVRPEHCDA